jgi:hypothetical protein
MSQGWVENQEADMCFHCDDVNPPTDSAYMRWIELWNEGLENRIDWSLLSGTNGREDEKQGFRQRERTFLPSTSRSVACGGLAERSRRAKFEGPARWHQWYELEGVPS